MSMVCSATCNHADVMDHVAPEGHIHVHGLCCASVTIFMYTGQATTGNGIGVCVTHIVPEAVLMSLARAA